MLVDYSTQEKIAEAQERLWNMSNFVGNPQHYATVEKAQRVAVEWFLRNKRQDNV